MNTILLAFAFVFFVLGTFAYPGSAKHTLVRAIQSDECWTRVLGVNRDCRALAALVGRATLCPESVTSSVRFS